ncbi:putative competence-damage inducible protein [Caloramator mitchellensis]|uniref:Putative competence-damage inducible protein n=1 Tax=Caloramator mitchellensis TaxID=908809 RepID=A0A0R3JTN4_CALMK|nr:competence/damage-inducible protein A [Caloramator mitchellensis]KRQ86902.1 putative competence-damage inducible protein [Caloramator mitchellensis]
MICEIISIGTELLMGDIINTNAQYIANRLKELGIFVYYQTVVGDNEERLKKAFEIAYSRSDMVITTGGLGPTKDDLSKEVAAKFFDKRLVLDQNSLNKIEAYFAKRNLKLTESNKKQAFIIEGGLALVNDFGTAPGMFYEDNSGKILIMMPGPPREMVPMFENQVVPLLEPLCEDKLFSSVIRICGIGESFVEDRIIDLIENQTNPTIAPYVKEGEVTLRITARAKDEKEAEKLLSPVKNEIKNRLKGFVYGEGNTSLEDVVGKLLIEKGLKLSIAESCTGGMITSRLVNFPGISASLVEGVVTYSNESKVNRLNVSEETLKNYGAVSKECAMEMAKGVALSSGADIGISTTGIAGPAGGTAEKPVGLVYLGLYYNGITKWKELRLSGDRHRIRTLSTVNALHWLINELKGLERE